MFEIYTFFENRTEIYTFYENRTEIYIFYEKRTEIYFCILFENRFEILSTADEVIIRTKKSRMVSKFSKAGFQLIPDLMKS